MSPNPTENEDESAKAIVKSICWNGDCPHCGKSILFELRTDVGTFYDARDVAAQWRRDLTQDEQELLTLAESTGVFNSFETALAQRPKVGAVQVIRNPRRTFLRFLEKVREVDADPEVMLYLKSTFGTNHKFSIMQNGDIALVMIDQQLRFFVPVTFLHDRQKRIAPVDGKLKIAAMTTALEPLSNWVRTRMGYVPVEGQTFLREIRKRSYGAFARLL